MKTLVVRCRPPTQNNHKGETVAGLWEQQHAGRFTAETRDRKCLRDSGHVGPVVLNSLCYFVEDTCLNMMMSLPFQARLSSLWLQDKNCLTESVPPQAQVLTVRRRHHVTLWWSSTHVCQWNMWLWRHVHEHAALTICPADVEALRSTSSAPEWDHHLFMELCTRLLSRWRNTKCEQTRRPKDPLEFHQTHLWDLLYTYKEKLVLVMKFYIWSIRK